MFKISKIRFLAAFFGAKDFCSERLIKKIQFKTFNFKVKVELKKLPSLARLLCNNAYNYKHETGEHLFFDIRRLASVFAGAHQPGEISVIIASLIWF